MVKFSNFGLTAFDDHSTWYLTFVHEQMAPTFDPKYLKGDESIHEFGFSF